MADIGSTLREARMRARIDITEVEARTKIRAKYLRAIENEEWDLLPGPVYVKSFLRAYGDFLGLDSRLLIDDYKRRYERPADQELRPMASLHRERERDGRPRIPSWMLIAGVLVAVVVALGVLGALSNNSKVSPPAGVHAGTHKHRRHRVRPRAAAVSLQLVPTGSVYVCLVDGRGRRRIPGKIFSAGQSVPVERAGQLKLTLGNNAVQMKVNGKPVAISASPSSIGYLIRPSGTTILPAAQQPRCA